MTQLTIATIAKLAGTSPTTVSRVLNEHPNVREDMRKHVLRVIQEQGYVPQATARSLATRRTNLIGILFPRDGKILFDDPFFSIVMQGVAQVSIKYKYVPMLCLEIKHMERATLFNMLRSRQFDGFILMGAEIDDPVLPFLMKEKIPFVRFGRHPYLHKLSWVDVDNVAAAAEVVNHFIALGHRHIALIAGSLSDIGALDRRDGYKKALLEAGVPIEPDLICGNDWAQESGYQAMKRLLQRSERPTAVFAMNDILAIGALRAIQEEGLSVPGDVALIGFNDLPLAEHTTPPLTTVRHPSMEMATRAMELLNEQIEQKEGPFQQILFPTKLVIRESCGGRRSAP